MLAVYRLLPWRALSRAWGRLAALSLPAPLTPILVQTYCSLFGCRLEEAVLSSSLLLCSDGLQDPPSVWGYPSLAAFFTRQLVAGARVVDRGSRLVLPADGTLTFCGEYNGASTLQQVRIGSGLPLNCIKGERSPVQSGQFPRPSRLLAGSAGQSEAWQGHVSGRYVCSTHREEGAAYCLNAQIFRFGFRWNSL